MAKKRSKNKGRITEREMQTRAASGELKRKTLPGRGRRRTDVYYDPKAPKGKRIKGRVHYKGNPKAASTTKRRKKSTTKKA